MKIKKTFDKQLFMIDCLIDLTANLQNDMFKTIAYRKTDGFVWFEFWVVGSGKKYLHCSYHKVWSIFENIFDMKDADIEKFIENILFKYSTWGRLTLGWAYFL